MCRAEQVVQLQSHQGPWCMGIAGCLCALRGNWQISMQEAFSRGRAEVAAGVWEGPWRWQNVAESADVYLNVIVPQTLDAGLFLFVCVAKCT